MICMHRRFALALLLGLAHQGGMLFAAEIDDPAPNPPELIISDALSPQTAVNPHSDSSSSDLAPELIALRHKVRQALSIYYARPINTREHNPWEVFHWIIGYGTDAQVRMGGPTGRQVNAIGYLCFNGACRNGSLMMIERGLPAARKGPYVQGHHGQFLAVLAQAYVQPDYPIQVQGRSFTVADFVEYEKLTCRSGMELTFKLIALAHYLPTDESWQNDQGQTWTIDRLTREEIAAPINGAACGGTHRLMGISYAYKKRQQRGEPIEGESLRAQQYIRDYQQYTYRLQNADGSFSTSWLKGPGAQPNLDRRVQTSGHILEWLAYSVEDDELTDPRLVKAVDYLATVLIERRNHRWQVGHLGHALHGLALYDARLFQPADEAGPLAGLSQSEPQPLDSWRSSRSARHAERVLR